MEPRIQELYNNMRAAGFISSAVTIEKFAAGVASEEGQRKLYKNLAAISVPGSEYGGAGLPEEQFMEQFFSKKKIQPQPEPSPAASETGFPDFIETSSSPNAPAPTATGTSTFEPVFQQDPVSNTPGSESGVGGQSAASPAPEATDANGFAALPGNLIPGGATRDVTAPAPIVDRGEVKRSYISGNESISGYALQKNAVSRKESQQDAAPSMETQMSSGNESDEAKAAMVYAEDARRQADIAITQLEQAYGPDWRKTAPQNDPDRILLNNAVKAQAKAYDHYQAYTGGTNLDGTEDPIAFGENRRRNLPSYEYKKTYDSKTVLRGEKRQLDNIAEYGEAARFQTRYADTLLKEKYGEDWQDQFTGAVEAISNDVATQSDAALYQQITTDPDFQKWQSGVKAQETGYNTFKAKIDESPAYQQRLLDAAAAQANSNRLSEERPGPEALGVLINPVYAAKTDPLSKNWIFRKSAQLIGAVASLPRTVGQGLSGKDDGWRVGDEVASWADELIEGVETAYPKPDQMSRPLYERVTEFNGNEAVVDDKGKLLKIRGKDGKEVEITPENKKAFEESGAAEKAKEKFNGATAAADKVLDAAADLMLYRFMGGGSKPGVIASSFLMQHQQSYREAVVDMQMSAGDAAQYALVTSTLTGVLEAYLGDIETTFAKPGIAAAIKAGKKEAMALAGKQSGAEVAIAAMKPVIKETVGENAEEFTQSVQDHMTRSAYNNATGSNLETGMSTQEMKETALVTTLLTSPAAALGLPAHVEANRRSALLAAVKDQERFNRVLQDLEDNQAITLEKAAEMKATIERLSTLNNTLPPTMPDEERSHVLALQEYSDTKRAQAAQPETVTAVKTMANEDAKAADQIIENIVRDEEKSPTPEAAPEPKPKAQRKGKKVAEVVVTENDTPEVAQEKVDTVVNDAATALENRGVVVTPDIRAEVTPFVDDLTQTPLVSEQETPLADAINDRVEEFIQEKGIEPPKIKEETPADTAAVMMTKGAKPEEITSDPVIEKIAAHHDVPVEEAKAQVEKQIKTYPNPLAGKFVAKRKAQQEFGLDEQQAETFQEELPATATKVEALSDQDVQDAADFVEAMGGDLDRVIASVNGAVEEMDRAAFEELKKKNPTVHQLFFDELSNEDAAPDTVPVSGSRKGKETGVRPAKTNKTSGSNIGKDVGRGTPVEGGQVNGTETPGEPDTGGIRAPETATASGAVEAASAGLVTPEQAVAAISGNERAAAAVVEAGPKIEESAETTTDILDAVEGADFQAIPNPEGDMTPLSPAVFVVRGDMVYVAKYEGYEDILRDMGGNFVPGKGWAFPAGKRWAVAAAMKRTAKATPADISKRKNSGDDGRTAAAMGDKDVLVTAKKTEKAISEGKTLPERVAAAKAALHVQEDERKTKVQRTIERLKTAFPGIEVVTDPELIKDALHKLRIKDAPAGFTYEGKVYIDMEMAGIDTPIHEFGHIWSTWLKANKPKVHQQGLDAVRGTEYEQIVREDERYGYLGEEADVLDEALSQAIGERGARLGEQNDWAAFKAFMAKAKSAIKSALGFDPMKMSAKQYADAMAAKMLSGDVLMEETSEDIAKLESGVKFLFAGKTAAEVSDLTKGDLFTARYMEQKGHSPRDIWQATNWWRGPDGHWRYEVNDKGAETTVPLQLLGQGEKFRLSDALSHPEFFKVYPAARDIPVVFMEREGSGLGATGITKTGGQYIFINTANVKTEAQLRSVLLHEAQHIIQNAEGFGIGLPNNETANTIFEANFSDAVLEKDIERIRSLSKALSGTVSDLYTRASGEVEARNVQARADMEERVFPEDTMDVAPAEQMVLFMTDGAFEKIVHGFDGTQAAPKAKFQHAGNTLREASLRAAARQLVDIEVKNGGTPRDQAVPFIATELGLDEALVGQMWDEAAHKYAPKNIIDTTASGVTKSVVNVTNKLGKWANKWLGTYRGLPKEVFRGTQQMQRDISAEMYRASKLGDDLSKALKKYPPEMAGVVQNVLEGNAEWSLLPPDLVGPVQAVRDSVDSLSRKLLLSGAVKGPTIVKVVGGEEVEMSKLRTVMENMGIEIGPDESGLVDEIEGILGKPPLERTDEEVQMVNDFLDDHKVKMGTYLNRSYRAHQYKDWGDKTPDGFKRIPPEAVDQARKFFVKQLQEKYKALVDRLAKKDEKAAKKIAKLQGLINDGQSALQQPGLDPAEILSRSNEIGSLQKQVDDLEKQVIADRERIAKEMDDVSAQLGKIDDVIANYLYGQKTDSSTSPTDIAGKKNESILSRKEDVPEELRALLGEYRDPVVNYATTVAKISHLMAAQDFLNDMKVRYGGIYFHESENSPPGNYVQVSMENDPAFGPIDGWWTTPDILEGLKDMRSPAAVSAWEKNWATYFVQRVKLGKTIASPITHVRNFFGNTAFMVMNGWNPLRMFQAAKELAPMFNGGDKTAWRAYAERLHKLGVFGESVSAGDLEALRTYSSWDTKGSEVDRYATFIEKLFKLPGKAYDTAKKAYEAEDNFYRMMSFENEKRRYAQAMYGKPFSDLDAEERDRVEQKAADIVSQILPTYSYVPKLVQSIRRIPFVGTFVAFPSEMVRVSYNNLALAAQEMKDSRTRSLGARRLFGAALVHSAEFWLLALAKDLAGYDDDEWENANKFVPPFERNGALLPLKRDNKGQMGYINLSYTNPYSFIPKAYRAFIADPKDSVAKSTVDAGKSLLDPFISPELSFMALTQLFMNQDDWGRPIRQEAFQGPLGSTWLAKENIDAQMRFLANKLQPGIVKSVRDAYDISQSNPSRSGKVKSWETFTLSHALGLSIQRIDPTFSYGNQMYRLTDQKNQARKNYSSAQKRYNLGYATVQGESPNDTALLARKDAEFKAALKAEYETSKAAYARILHDAVELTKALRALGVKDSVIMLNMGGFSKQEKAAILSGQTNIPLTFKRKGRY